MRKIVAFALPVVLLLSCHPLANESESIVEIRNGKIEGTTNPETGVSSFKGIPFAKPPVGDLRWKAPQPLDNWEGILECKQFSASAVQATPAPYSMWTFEFMAPLEPLSEDCLYLNIWTAAKNPEEKLPVLVYIHGGAFTGGSGSVPIYDGEEMARKGVVFVTINYRLGVFGFLAHPELTAEAPYGSSGNYGLLDQIASLKWVNENISAFGGDPGNVTIAGQSAGAFSVNYLVASPLTKGLIHRAIPESGGAVLPTNNLARGSGLKEAELAGLELEKSLGVSSIEEMRAIPAEELFKARAMASPIVDGYVLPSDVYTIFSTGQQNDIPVMTGWNANEGLGGPPVSATQYVENARKQYGEQSNEFLSCFPGSTEEEAKNSQDELGSLMIFGLQAFKWMEFQNQTGTAPVYMYHFTRKVPYGEGQQDYGAFHTGEVPYAYHNLRMSKIRPWTEIDHSLEEVMSSYWVNFARNGNPNGENLPEWKPCRAEDYFTMFLGDTQEMKSIPNLRGMKFLTGFFESKRMQSAQEN